MAQLTPTQEKSALQAKVDADPNNKSMVFRRIAKRIAKLTAAGH